ncbi:MAG: enoyl-CoA hydratase/isomerase family protein [Phycisphaerales bacterium]
MILSRHEGPVAVIALNRPGLRNALTPEMFDHLRRAVDAAAGDPSTRALLLTGEGKVFCGGFDLKLCLADPAVLAQLLRALHETIERLLELDIPVVIAAHGAAIAGGCALLGAADVAVSDEHAKLGYPVTPLGVSPAISAPYLSQAATPGVARARLLDPALLSGRDALRRGLIHECVPGPDRVLPRALEIAGALASKPPGAIAATRGWLRSITSRAATPDHRRAAVEASLSLVGGAEERERLARALARS